MQSRHLPGLLLHALEILSTLNPKTLKPERETLNSEP